MSTDMGQCNNNGCNKPAKSTCGGCSSQVYCSRECQKSSWEEHSYECSPKAQPLSYDAPGLRKDRPTVSSPAEFEALVEEVKRTYYPGAVSTSKESQHKNGVPLGYITIKSGNSGTMLEKCTKDELNAHIILILTKKRQKMKKRFTAAIVGNEEAADPSSQWLGAELAPNVSRAFFRTFLPQYEAASNTRYKFDLLYGFTAAIYEYWFWMRRHPYGWDGHDMLKALAAEWNCMLSKNPEELGLDPVFSYRAIRQMMTQFKRDVEEESCACPSGLLFDFK